MNQSLSPSITPLTAQDHPAQDALIRKIWIIGMDALREETYGRYIDAPWQEKISQSVKAYLETPGVEAIKATYKGDLAGFLSYRIDRENLIGQIGYNAVDPVYRGHGIAKKMLRHALDKLAEAGVKHVEVVTGQDDNHAAARKLYEGAGFQPLRGIIYYTLALK